MSTVNTTSTTTTPTTSNTSTAGTDSTVKAQAGLNSNYADFLKLLTTQLQNQDPTQPLDTNQLTAQIAQLSQVQQAVNTNSKLDQLLALYNSTQATNAVSYIGKQVDATGNQIELTTGTDNSGKSVSNAALVYTLPSDATSATVTVTDSAGNTVFTAAGTKTAGRNQLIWDGTNTTGGKATAGAYKFTVSAKDAAGKDLTATTFTTGVVTAVETANGTNSLSLGNLTVPLTSVQSIYTAGSNPGV